MKRIVIIGSSCSGKSTFAKKLSAALQIKHIELDELHWQPDWKERPDKEFIALVEQAISSDTWIVDGNYSVARDVVWPKATTIIWLNYSFALVLYRSISRSIKRALTKEKVCTNNIETFRQSFMSKESIILWVITTFHSKRSRYTKLLKSELASNAKIIEFHDTEQTNEFLTELNRSALEMQQN